MEIGLIGCGIIGGAFNNWQEAHTKNVIRINDEPKGIIESFDTVRAIFICLPCPTRNDRRQDTSIIVKKILEFRHLRVPFILRSTVLPGTTDDLVHRTGASIYFCPEFLTERQADSDFNKHSIAVGVPEIYQTHISELMGEIFPEKEIILISNVEAEISKYTSNCFGAVKVHYFNVIYSLCRNLGADYEKVLKAAMIPGFIEPTHTTIPGPDGQFGYGGKCLPKDLKAFIGCLTENRIINQSLRRVEAENNIIRRFMSNKPDVDNDLLN